MWVIESLLIKTYIENFETRISPALKAAATVLKSGALHSDALISTLQGALSEFVALRAGASFLSAARSEELAKEMILTLELVLVTAKSDESTLGETRGLHDILSIAIHLTEGTCQLLNDFGSESGIDYDPNLIDLIERLARAHQNIRAHFTRPKVA